MNDISNGNLEKKNVQISSISDEVLIANSTQIFEKFGWFQVRSLIFLSFPAFCAGELIMSFVFLNIVPPFQCQNRFENYTQNNVSINLKATDNQCIRSFSASNTTQSYKDDQSLQNSTYIQESCLDDLIFNKSNGNTLVSQFGLVCEAAWLRPFTSGSFIIGMFLGTVFGVRLADRFGRRPISLLAFLTCSSLLLATAFSTSLPVYYSLTCISGACYTLVYITTYTWILEMAGSPNERVWALCANYVGYSAGGISSSLIAYFAQDWNWIYLVESALFLVGVVLLWFVSESPSWLIQKQRTKDLARLLRNVVKTNKLHISDVNDKSELESLQDRTATTTSKSSDLDMILLWKNKVLRRRLILVCLIWIVAVISFYTNSLNSANLGGNAYLNNVVGNAFEIFAVALTSGVLRKLGRKSTHTLILIACGCLFIGTPLAKKWSPIAGICLAMAGRCFGATAIMMTYLFTGEIFPTLLRSTSICICGISSRFFGIVTPFLIFVGEEVDLSIPFYVMGGMSFASIYLVLLLPETSNSLLLNTLEDALALKDPSILPQCRILSKKNQYKVSNPQKLTIVLSHNDPPI